MLSTLEQDLALSLRDGPNKIAHTEPGGLIMARLPPLSRLDDAVAGGSIWARFKVRATMIWVELAPDLATIEIVTRYLNLVKVWLHERASQSYVRFETYHFIAAMALLDPVMPQKGHETSWAHSILAVSLVFRELAISEDRLPKNPGLLCRDQPNTDRSYPATPEGYLDLRLNARGKPYTFVLLDRFKDDLALRAPRLEEKLAYKMVEYHASLLSPVLTWKRLAMRSSGAGAVGEPRVLSRVLQLGFIRRMRTTTTGLDTPQGGEELVASLKFKGRYGSYVSSLASFSGFDPVN